MMPAAYVWRALSSVGRFREGYAGGIYVHRLIGITWRGWLHWRTG